MGILTWCWATVCLFLQPVHFPLSLRIGSSHTEEWKYLLSIQLWDYVWFCKFDLIYIQFLRCLQRYCIRNFKLGKLWHQRCSTFQRTNAQMPLRLWPDRGERSQVVKCIPKEPTITIAITVQLTEFPGCWGLFTPCFWSNLRSLSIGLAIIKYRTLVYYNTMN